MIAHFCGCGFCFVAEITSKSGIDNWLYNFGYEHSDWIEKYITSLYWAVITMSTVGYGDIFPINKYEKLFVIIVNFISCGVFAYCLNKISSILGSMTN